MSSFKIGNQRYKVGWRKMFRLVATLPKLLMDWPEVERRLGKIAEEDEVIRKFWINLRNLELNLRASKTTD